jgi:hypothetical protein
VVSLRHYYCVNVGGLLRLDRKRLSTIVFWIRLQIRLADSLALTSTGILGNESGPVSQNGPLDECPYDLKFKSILRQRLRFLHSDIPGYGGRFFIGRLPTQVVLD